jgi:hypothetical protein
VLGSGLLGRCRFLGRRTAELLRAAMRVPGRARQGLLGRCRFLGRRTAELLQLREHPLLARFEGLSDFLWILTASLG